MKKASLFFLIFVSLVSCRTGSDKTADLKAGDDKQIIDTADMTNNFYDNAETFLLPVKDLEIVGEIANPGRVDFTKLPKHSVIVKEALLDSSGGNRFVGAYRYDGYSLFDILDDRILKKVNSDDFKPIIDLYIEIENAKGQKVIFSWGEIYYPGDLHKIIIASAVSRIVPSKTKELWPLPAESKIVAGHDLITERNIDSPVKITVRSFPCSLAVNRNLPVMYSPEVRLFKAASQVGTLKKVSDKLSKVTYDAIFYGRGRGIHSTTPFSGVPVREILREYYPFSRENLQAGIFCLAGIDGYRCAVSYSELFNRNDQQEFLLVGSKEGEDGGQFRIFAPGDFFSDRAVKALCEIRLGF
jgi:hypothetical protein